MVREYVPFFSYLAIVIKSTSMQFYIHGTSTGSTGELV